MEKDNDKFDAKMFLKELDMLLDDSYRFTDEKLQDTYKDEL